MVNNVALGPDEIMLLTCLANRVDGGRAFGGHLSVTSRRVVFTPVALSAAHGGAEYEVALADLAAADVAPRGLNPRDGSWRRRLRLKTRQGHIELFVVWQPKKVARLLGRVLRET